MYSSGLVDTTAVCVRTTARELNLIEASLRMKQQKKEWNILLRLEKELGRNKNKAATQQENSCMREATMRRRTGMAGLGMAEVKSQSPCYTDR